MSRLLRGVIQFSTSDDVNDLLVNHRMLARAIDQGRIEWGRPDDAAIWTYVRGFFLNTMGVPPVALMAEYFEAMPSGVEALERLKDIEAKTLYVGTNYHYLLEGATQELSKIKMLKLLKDAQEVVSKGMEVKEGREKKHLQGPRDAAEFLGPRLWDPIPDEGKPADTAGDIGQSNQLREEYARILASPSRAWGVISGIEVMDRTFRGLRPGQLHVHAGFAGHLKSTLAMTWAVTARARHRRNVLYVSLEMPKDQIHRIAAVCHSGDPRFGGRALDYIQVRDAQLSPEDRAFYDEVLADWEGNNEHCQIRVWCPDQDVTIDDIRNHAMEVERSMAIDLIVIDHAGLVMPRRRNHNYLVEQNSIFRDSKALALQFRHKEASEGIGVPVLLLAQINRQGLQHAEKNGGVYSLYHLAFANEAERSADFVTATYLDDNHRDNETTLLSCLKSRDTAHFPPTLLRARLKCRRIENPVVSNLPDMHVDDGADWMGEV